jgi:tRNA dimethylallyltransferase
MCIPDVPNPMVMIVGPTGVGKTAISISLAKKYNGEVVSADSRLLYIGMDIGTAKPNVQEMCGIPHHLIDVSTPDKQWSLAQFQQEAVKVIDAIHSRGRLPLMVGGTGQYITAILEGWLPPVQEPDQKLRRALDLWAKEIGAEELHTRLSLLDPDAALSIDKRNVRRTMRAMEVIFSTGQKFSSQKRKTGSRYSILMIGLCRPREELYSLIDQRIDEMIRNGLVAEVKSLIKAGYPADLPAFSAIGYEQIIYYLKGRTTLEESVHLMKRFTRQFIRRQSNWFKTDDPRIHWLEVKEGILDEIAGIISQEDNWLIPEK